MQVMGQVVILDGDEVEALTQMAGEPLQTREPKAVLEYFDRAIAQKDTKDIGGVEYLQAQMLGLFRDELKVMARLA